MITFEITDKDENNYRSLIKEILDRHGKERVLHNTDYTILVVGCKIGSMLQCSCHDSFLPTPVSLTSNVTEPYFIGSLAGIQIYIDGELTWDDWSINFTNSITEYLIIKYPNN